MMIGSLLLDRFAFGLRCYFLSKNCLRLKSVARKAQNQNIRSFYTTQRFRIESSLLEESIVPFRKHIKDFQKEQRRKEASAPKKPKGKNQRVQGWKLSVGIEIHALLNTERKLFSSAFSTVNNIANTQVALFDAAIPGSQPIFQKETLIPAIRAALALNCEIQTVSKFDRKHYFHWDQPAGYQITQYYEPLAKNGYIRLYSHDGIANEDGDQVCVKIKQIQMEQDTAKTIALPAGYLVDLNRAGLPLIEIITEPEIHSPQTAAALVRKIQILLTAVDACVVGMEFGGLRADINVSVSRENIDPNLQHGQVPKLGQRTEIKNLCSFKSIEDAIIAERDRQISILEGGGTIDGETRGWKIGTTMTKKLRGKGSEVDYKYMPDPDLPPVIIGEDCISHLKATLGILPDEELNLLINEYGLVVKDALSLLSLENGGRAEYFYKLVDNLQQQLPSTSSQNIGKLCLNWVMHDMASLRHDEADIVNPLNMDPRGNCIIPHEQLATLLFQVETGRLLRKPAKFVLRELFRSLIEGKPTTVLEIIDREGLWGHLITVDQYRKLARATLSRHENILKVVLEGNDTKVKFLLGTMLKEDEKGAMDPIFAEKVLREAIKECGESV